MKRVFIALISAAAVFSASSGMAQTAREVLGPGGVVPLTEQQRTARPRTGVHPVPRRELGIESHL
jgi:hypothetical protein